MKLSDYRDEEAIEVLADLIDPATEIFSDKAVQDALRNEPKKTKIVKIILKEHKKDVFEMLAALDRIPVEEYHCSIMTLPVKLLDILNDKELMGFLSVQAETDLENAFGSATENTEEKEK